MNYLPLIFLLSVTTLLNAQDLDTTFYDSGNYSIYTRNENGKIEGIVSYYNENHTLISTVEYKNRKIDAIWTFFNSEGKKNLSVSYKNNLMHGEAISYHPNGKIEWIKPYKYGKLDGQRIVRDSNGNFVNGNYTTTNVLTKYTVNCEEGVPNGKFEMIRFDGTIALQGNYVNGYPDGIFTYYDSEGNIERKEFYKKGKFIKGGFNYYQNPVRAYTKLVIAEPNNVQWLLRRAEASINDNDIFMAKMDFKKVLEIDTLNTIALYNLGYLYAAKGQYKRSEKYLLKCIESDKNFYRAYYNLGYIYYQTDKKQDAIKYFSEAIKIKPDYSEAYYNRSKAYESIGDNKKVRKDMKIFKKLKTKPNKK